MSCGNCGNKKKCTCPVQIPGPIGLTGPQGDEGVQGPQPGYEWMGTQIRFENPDGSFGPWVNLQGPPGSSGNGSQGLPGIQGPAGPMGPTGLTGPIGPQGVQGPIGPMGPAGTNGLNAFGITGWLSEINPVSTNVPAILNKGYISGNLAGTNTFLLPLTAVIGDVIEITVVSGDALVSPNVGVAISYGDGTNVGVINANPLSLTVQIFESVKLMLTSASKWTIMNFETTDPTFPIGRFI